MPITHQRGEHEASAATATRRIHDRLAAGGDREFWLGQLRALIADLEDALLLVQDEIAAAEVR